MPRVRAVQWLPYRVCTQSNDSKVGDRGVPGRGLDLCVSSALYPFGFIACAEPRRNFSESCVFATATALRSGT